MLATLHLVRHGEVANPGGVVYGALPGFHLSAAGEEQAAQAARHLIGCGAAVLLTSPLDRAVETAATIAREIALAPDVDDRLTEWRLSDRWEGTPWSDLQTVFPGELEAYAAHPDDLDFAPETLAAVAERMGALVEDLGGRHPGATAVLVSHQDPVQALRLALTGRSLGTLHQDKPGHGSVITLVSAPSGWTERGHWSPRTESTPFPP